MTKMTELKFFNTLSRTKETFEPIETGKVGIYSCGPTVYSSPHIGNMYAYVCWDVLVRVLQYLGYEVKNVINITDVGHLVLTVTAVRIRWKKVQRKKA